MAFQPYQNDPHMQYQQQQPPPSNGNYDQNYSQPPNGNYEQNYTQAPPNYGPTQQAPKGKQSFDEVFKLEKPKYNDLWAGILLILVFLGFTAVSGIALHGYATNHRGGIYDNGNQFTLNSNTIILFVFVLVVAFVLSWLYLLAAGMFTKQFIWLTGILNLVLGFATAIYYLYRRQYAAGVVFLIFALFTVFCFFTWIKRIPFSVLMLQTSVDVARNYGHVFIVSALGGFAALAFGAWYSVTFAAVYVRFAPDSNTCNANGSSCSYSTVIGLLVFITFAGYVSLSSIDELC
jgi:hypothetical protein